MKVGKSWMIAAVGGGVGLLVVPVYEALIPELPHSSATAVQSPVPATAVSLMVGQQQTFMLQSHAGTGYCWQFAEPLPADSPFSAVLTGGDCNEADCCGFPVPVTLIITALRPGSSTLNIIYRRPWESDTLPAREEKFEIVVQNPVK